MRKVFIGLILLGVAMEARAEENLAAAREHYKRGSTLYDLSRFAEAAREYELAFENKDEPILLFNIAQAWRFAGEYQRAINSYKAFLRRLPKTANRAEVEQRIVEMQKLLDDTKKTQLAPPTGISNDPRATTLGKPDSNQPRVEPSKPIAPERPVEPPKPVEPEKPAQPTAAEPPKPAEPVAAKVEKAPDEPKPGRAKLYAGIALAVVGVAVIAVGGGMAAMAGTAKDEIDNPKMGYVFDPATQSRARTFEAVEYAMFGVGAAALVTGVALAVVGYRQNKSARPQARITPWAGGNSAGATLQLSF
jgi:tetratricopeptide (TPR) repeat protein